MYGGAGLVAVAGGVSVGGVAIATTGTPGGGVVVLLAGVVGVLLGYRAVRVRRAAEIESG